MKADDSRPAVAWLRTAAMLTTGVFILASTFSIAISQTALALAAMLWIGLMIVDPSRRPGGLGLALPLSVFFLISILSSLLCDDPAAALKNLKNYPLFAAVWLIASLADDARIRSRIYGVLLISGSASALYGIAIYALGMGKGSLGRTAGTFSNSMTYGGIIMLLLSLYFALTVCRGVSRRWRVLSAAASLATALALLFSMTRSSWLGMIASSLVILAVLQKRWIPVFLVAAAALALLLPHNFQDRIRTIWDPGFRTNVQRINLLKGGISIFKEYPVLGTGPVDLGEIYKEHMPPGAVHVHGHMHNIFLHVAVTLGSVGLAAFLWLLVSMILVIGRVLRLDLPPPDRALAAGSLGAIAGFIINGLFEWNFGDAEVLTVLLILLGLCAAVGRDRARVVSRAA